MNDLGEKLPKAGDSSSSSSSNNQVNQSLPTASTSTPSSSSSATTATGNSKVDISDDKKANKDSGKSRKELEEEEREKMQVLVSNFTESQLDRYEMYRRAAFPKAAIKRIMQGITGNSVSQNVVIAMSGITKVFVGEIVEAALDAMEKLGETGPLQPKHLRESVRKLRMKGMIPRSKTKRYSPYSV